MRWILNVWGKFVPGNWTEIVSLVKIFQTKEFGETCTICFLIS